MSALRELKQRIAASKAAFVEPCLPTLAEKPPAGSRWIHEIKHDGYRLQARRDPNGVHLITRNGFNWTRRYPTIAAGIEALRCRSCIIDGEVVVVDASGLATFDKLRHGPRENHDALFYAFDLIELDGKDLRGEPVETRKLRLERIIKRLNGATSSIRFVDHLQFDDADLIFEHACALGCEGIVSKRLGSKYRSGRSPDWIKVKNPAAPAARRLEEEIGMIEPAKSAEQPCPICHGARWVCEEHPDRPWAIAGGCGYGTGSCAGPGMPCEFCNPCSDIDDPPDMPPGFKRGPDLS